MHAVSVGSGSGSSRRARRTAIRRRSVVDSATLNGFSGTAEPPVPPSAPLRPTTTASTGPLGGGRRLRDLSDLPLLGRKWRKCVRRGCFGRGGWVAARKGWLRVGTRRLFFLVELAKCVFVFARRTHCGSRCACSSPVVVLCCVFDKHPPSCVCGCINARVFLR